MAQLFTLSGAVLDAPEVEAWFEAGDASRLMVRPWFKAILACGEDVGQLLHDDCPTACVGGAAFAYVNAFTAHASVGFFHGGDLADPHRLLEGSGKRMRHVKLRWGETVDEAALRDLIARAYADIRARLAAV